MQRSHLLLVCGCTKIPSPSIGELVLVLLQYRVNHIFQRQHHHNRHKDAKDQPHGADDDRCFAKAGQTASLAALFGHKGENNGEHTCNNATHTAKHTDLGGDDGADQG